MLAGQLLAEGLAGRIGRWCPMAGAMRTTAVLLMRQKSYLTANFAPC